MFGQLGIKTNKSLTYLSPVPINIFSEEKLLFVKDISCCGNISAIVTENDEFFVFGKSDSLFGQGVIYRTPQQVLIHDPFIKPICAAITTKTLAVVTPTTISKISPPLFHKNGKTILRITGHGLFKTSFPVTIKFEHCDQDVELEGTWERNDNDANENTIAQFKKVLPYEMIGNFVCHPTCADIKGGTHCELQLPLELPSILDTQHIKILFTQGNHSVIIQAAWNKTTNKVNFAVPVLPATGSYQLFLAFDGQDFFHTTEKIHGYHVLSEGTSPQRIVLSSQQNNQDEFKILVKVKGFVYDKNHCEDIKFCTVIHACTLLSVLHFVCKILQQTLCIKQQYSHDREVLKKQKDDEKAQWLSKCNQEDEKKKMEDLAIEKKKKNKKKEENEVFHYL
ncbi:hypothetical protein RFI_24049 [Reticulomyxa filosa]|uniref:Uncharacterized protein n=1 Tax=Reticulomyxa filosa TaxID=46433 RepID=X6MIQ8_RETFI|nr:hypothetical protein RFI_24049 [Reticulomyxa filosa]|eukprot:ETO13327.1 hypothetical protein RFI_24049 [Reticulomyxa filosa]